MGIVCQCPNGHRIKVKDRFAGKRGVCPTCGATFRIPASPAEPDEPAVAPTDEGHELPLARFVPVDPAILATLPRALPWAAAPPVAAAAEPVDHGDATAADVMTAPTPEAAFRPTPPAIAERPDLSWRIAFPGCDPSEPVDGVTLHEWLAGGQAEGTELVWRADWPQWLPVRDVFPEFFPGA